MIPPFRRGKDIRPLPPPQIMDHAIDLSTSVDINPLRGLEDPSLYDEFDRWFAGDMTVDRRVQHSRSFFQVILGHVLMGWLGDEVFLNKLWNNEGCAIDSLVYDESLMTILYCKPL
ncbi:hypothetical protein AB3S75_037183 [Citrus x aurantiifolia]